MTTPRSDTAYNYWREASDKFDYYVTGLTGALTAYIGQSLKPVALGLNPQTLEVAALALLVGSVYFGFRRIERVVMLFNLQAQQLYNREVAGSSLKATENPTSINEQTGEVFTRSQLLQRSKEHATRAEQLEPKIDDAKGWAQTHYHWRNRLLFVGFAALVAARLLPAYVR